MDRRFAQQVLNEIITGVPGLSHKEHVHLVQCLLNDCPLKRRKPGDVLLQVDRPSGRFYLCLSGLLRNYYILAEGRFFNKSFIAAHGVAGSLREYVTTTASRFSIDCLEESLILEIPFVWLREHAREFSVQQFYLVMLEKFALAKELREESLLIDNATDRYLQFRQHYAALEQRIPDYHIAAYLGITAVAFSRLKKTIINLG